MEMSLPASGRRRWRTCFTGAAGFALLLLLAAAFTRLAVNVPRGPFADAVDFRAFYCAGAALDARRDPYRVEPMRSCQRGVLAAAGIGVGPHLLPAPFPPYAIAAFGVIARFPYRPAAGVWFAASILAVALTVVLTSELSGIRPARVAPALLFAAGIVPLLVAQIVPLVLAGALAAALAARRGRGWGVAGGALVLALEPHLALPVWLCLLTGGGPARRPLLFAGALPVALTLLAGPALDLEYVRAVLPQHARSELLNFGEQYALSPLLVGLGVPFADALRAGAVAYTLMLVAGVAAGGGLARRTGDRAFCVTVPLACSVVGGPFLHVHQIAVALPLGFMLLARQRRGSAGFALTLTAIAALAVPWQTIREALPVPAIPPGLPVSDTLHASDTPDASIETPYTAYVDALAPRVYGRSFADLALWKLPTWGGLIVLAAVAGFAARPDRYLPRALTGTELLDPNIRSPASPKPGTM
jgi:hypothetical protein